MTQSDSVLGTECRSDGCHCPAETSTPFAAIFDRLADGFFTLDEHWRFAYLNAAARCALQAGDAIGGKVFWDVCPEAVGTIFEVEFRRVKAGATSEFEAFYPALKIWLRVNAFPVGRGIAVSIADITETRRVQQQLADLNHELSERIREHEEVESFAHTVAHDLRSPLSAILGFSQALSEAAVNELGPRSQHMLRRIRNAAKQMDEMTEAIMMLCRLARSDVKRSLVDLSSIALDCVAALRDGEPERQVDASVAPCMWADCDAGLIKLVLHNLLSNAWKYTGRESRPAIEVGMELGPQQEMRYFVRDNGIGFGAADAQGVFEPFARMHADAFAGEGIGLATVKRVIDKHGGQVWAESQPGKGATFYFTLPQHEA